MKRNKPTIKNAMNPVIIAIVIATTLILITLIYVLGVKHNSLFRASLFKFAISVGNASVLLGDFKSDAKDELRHFPDSKEGFDRYVIYLPKQRDETDHEVEVFVGKVMMVDCNKHNLMGKFTSENLEGFRYDYLVFESNGLTTSTKMGCSGIDDHEEFIFSSYKTRYNSRLPVVVFVPEGFEVKYRIWSASDVVHDATFR